MLLLGGIVGVVDDDGDDGVDGDDGDFTYLIISMS
jgi:hypothetical protein